MPGPHPNLEEPAGGRCALLAQRHPGLGEGIRGLLATLFEHVVMVADETSLLACAARLRPTVAVVDLSLAPGTAAAWIPRLRAACPELKLVLVSAYGEPAARELAARSGAVLVLDREIATSLLPAIDGLLARADAPATEAPAPPPVVEPDRANAQEPDLRRT
jgi:DNA-binding NarL/FixJ family response regulator